MVRCIVPRCLVSKILLLFIVWFLVCVRGFDEGELCFFMNADKLLLIRS